VFFGYYDQVHAHTYYPPYLIRNSEEVPLPNNHGNSEGQTYSHYLIHDAAKQFIRDHKDEPFFCYMPITPPHGNFDIPDSDAAWQIFKDKDWPEQAKRYAAMVSMVDRQVGEVLDLLKELNLEQDTIVFFCGDNGGADYFSDPQHPRGFHSANKDPKTGVEFRGKKGSLYEGGLRIPMLARWPGRIPAGKVSDLLCYFPDVMPTIAEVTNATVPDDLDGMSLVPELMSETVAGRKQSQHEYLYWEIGNQIAVRMGNWKAIQPKADKWELYDFSKDVSESQDVADQHPEILAKLKGYAVSAHTPVIEGEFLSTAMHERDRQAKFGNRSKREQQSRVFSQAGLIPNDDLQVIQFSSQSDQRRAVSVLDGDPKTHWHTSFTPQPVPHPHEIVIDLGKRYTVRGFRYLARQDGGWNGAVKDCEFYVGNRPEEFGEPVAKASLKRSKEVQEVNCDPATGRFVRLRILSEVNGGPWGSIAELGFVGE
jgi:Sulfatase/F5/8 type C domain